MEVSSGPHRPALLGGKLPSPANLIPAGMAYTYAP